MVQVPSWLLRENGNNELENATVRQVNNCLGRYSSKSHLPATFRDYLKAKNTANFFVSPFYQDALFRKLKWNAKTNKRRDEALLVNEFKEAFGGPDDVVLMWGDWSKGQMRFQKPIAKIGLRRLFRRHNFLVFLVDEAYTSQRCYNCRDQFLNAPYEPQTPLEDARQVRPFYRIPNPCQAHPQFPNRRSHVLCHGLVQCTICKVKWNRDMNSACNIWKIARDIIDGQPRPMYLARVVKNDDWLE